MLKNQEQPELQEKKIEPKPQKRSEHRAHQAGSQPLHGYPDQGLVLFPSSSHFLAITLLRTLTVTVKIEELLALHAIPSLTSSKCIHHLLTLSPTKWPG